jgi:hypothetical protein
MPHKKPTPLGYLMLGLLATSAAGAILLFYLALFAQVSPLISHRLISVETQGRGVEAAMLVTREVCLSRESEAWAIRIFRRKSDDTGGPEEVFETPAVLTHLDAGCTSRSRRMPMQNELKRGLYSYQTAFRWCNDMGRCQSVWFEPFPLIIEGDGPDRRFHIPIDGAP